MTNQNQPNQLAIIQKDITDAVSQNIDRLQNEGLTLPPNYNHSNALKSAFFALSNSSSGNLLTVCTKESIANALLDMVVQGLSPMKTQCYFVKYGDVCKLNRSYFGTQVVLKRLTEVNDIWANVIYEGDKFKYENVGGRERLISHETEFENRDNAIRGAYAVIQTSEGDEILTVMTMKEIEASWSQSKTQQAVHKKFPQEMSKRTVINRAAKAFINTSDDSDLLIESINNTTENEYDETPTRKEINPDVEIREKANTEELDFQPTNQVIDAPINAEPHEEETPQPEPVVVGANKGPGF